MFLVLPVTLLKIYTLSNLCAHAYTAFCVSLAFNLSVLFSSWHHIAIIRDVLLFTWERKAMRSTPVGFIFSWTCMVAIQSQVNQENANNKLTLMPRHFLCSFSYIFFSFRSKLKFSLYICSSFKLGTW